MGERDGERKRTSEKERKKREKRETCETEKTRERVREKEQRYFN